MDMSVITSMPPKRLLLIAGAGIGAGLLWRHFQGKSAAATPVGPDGSPIDTSQLALAQNSAGNLGAAQSESMPSSNDATRDMGSGSFPLPVTKGVMRGADGIDYFIDAAGHILGPVYAAGSTTIAPPPTGGFVPDNTPVGVFGGTGKQANSPVNAAGQIIMPTSVVPPRTTTRTPRAA